MTVLLSPLCDCLYGLHQKTLTCIILSVLTMLNFLSGSSSRLGSSLFYLNIFSTFHSPHATSSISKSNGTKALLTISHTKQQHYVWLTPNSKGSLAAENRGFPSQRLYAGVIDHGSNLFLKKVGRKVGVCWTTRKLVPRWEHYASWNLRSG